MVIVVNVMLGLVEFMGLGVGGDFFVMVWYVEENKLYGLNVLGCFFW